MESSYLIASVLKGVLGDSYMQLHSKTNDLSFFEDAQRLPIDRSDFGAWHNDTFDWACSNIAERYRKINERFAKYTSADILACIKFESSDQPDACLNRQSNKWSRRVKFSTGASISLDNLIQCSSETRLSGSRNCEESKSFPDINITSVSPTKHSTAAENVLTRPYLDNFRTRVHACAWQDNVIQYTNPFDPRLCFQGFEKSLLPQQMENTSPEVEGPIPETFNCLIESDCPTEFTNNYLHAYRDFLRLLTLNAGRISTNFTDLPNDSNLEHSTDNVSKRNAHVPAFVGSLPELKYLWERILSTWSTWSNELDNDFPLGDNVSDKHSSKESCGKEPNILRETYADLVKRISPDKRTCTGSVLKPNNPCVTMVNSTSATAQISSKHGISENKKNETQHGTEWENEDDVNQIYLNEEDCTSLSALNDIADYVTQTSTSHTYADGDVQTFLRSFEDKKPDTTVGPSQMTTNKHERHLQDRTQLTLHRTNERFQVKEQHSVDGPEDKSSDEGCGVFMRSTDSTHSVPTSPAIRNTPMPVVPVSIEPSQYAPHSSMFWSHQQRQLQIPTQQAFPYSQQPLVQTHHPRHHQPQQTGHRQGQQLQPHSQQQHPMPPQPHIRHTAPCLVQNQYGLFVNQSQVQNSGHFEQFATPSNQYGHHHQQVTPASYALPHSHFNNSIPHQQTYGGATPNEHFQRDRLTVDDEVWYLNGIPHYHARPASHQEIMGNRVYRPLENRSMQVNGSQFRQWSANDTNSDIRLVTSSNVSMPPPPIVQHLPGGWYPVQNANVINAIPPMSGRGSYRQTGGSMPF